MSKYDEIMNMPHHVSRRHQQMSMLQRAAQFAPFAALSGHGAAILETARLTDHQIELSDGEKLELDTKLQYLLARLGERPMVSVTHFINDKLKAGGHYITTSGHLTKWNDEALALVMDDGTEIPIQFVIDMSQL